MNQHCPACGRADVDVFFERTGVPVHSCLRHETRHEALAIPRGDIALALCDGCGLVFNAAFDPGSMRYGAGYEESQAFSPHFASFARSLAADWVRSHGLAGGNVVEVGCGRGDFLRLLLDLGVGYATGIDPAITPAQASDTRAGRATWIARPLVPSDSGIPADAVVCRHTLEHVPDPGTFMGLLRAVCGDRVGTPLLLQVPDGAAVIEGRSFPDVYYEHCNYFSEEALRGLLSRSAFTDVDVRRVYDGQYLLAAANAAAAAPSSAEPTPAARRLRESARTFAADVAAEVEAWRRFLATEADGGSRVIAWGGGSKAVAWLNEVGPAAGVDAVVDINPAKWGTFLAGTGHEVLPPDRLREHRPGTVVVMNPVYRDEIAAMLAGLGLSPRVAVVERLTGDRLA